MNFSPPERGRSTLKVANAERSTSDRKDMLRSTHEALNARDRSP